MHFAGEVAARSAGESISRAPRVDAVNFLRDRWGLRRLLLGEFAGALELLAINFAKFGRIVIGFSEAERKF